MATFPEVVEYMSKFGISDEILQLNDPRVLMQYYCVVQICTHSHIPIPRVKRLIARIQ